jgi:hypothetical protein
MSAKKPPTAAKPARRATGQFIMNTALPGAVVSTINFGAVSVKAALPEVGELRRNVTIGQAAMARAMPKLMKPGVAFKMGVSTPLFRADPENPDYLIREVNGRVSTGTFVNGKFKVVSTKR